jgi:hypothetical protein
MCPLFAFIFLEVQRRAQADLRHGPEVRAGGQEAADNEAQVRGNQQE